MSKITFFVSLVFVMNLSGMEEAPIAINLPVSFAQPTCAFDHNLYHSIMLTSAESIQNVPDFPNIYLNHSARIIANTSPALAELVHSFPHDPRLGIVIRYAQAVAMRLSLFAEDQRAANIEWVRMVTPKDLRELYYICNGKLTNRIAGKAPAAGGQATLKEKFAQLLQQFKPEKIN